MNETPTKVADAVTGSWVYRLVPTRLWPYAQLARWERPIGWQLLMWPCQWSTMLAAAAYDAPPGLVVFYLALFFVGAVVMRGAGCTYNDLVDQDIDDRIARTRSRPLPSGRLSGRQALTFLLLQALIGLAVLLQFNTTTIALGILSLVTVAVYPFMKRVTWWPQLFLGLAFSWGALVGWSAIAGNLQAPALFLYAGCIFWVIGYDTIYALQDIEDDALVGVKSTARLFGEAARPAIALCYSGALVLWLVGFWLAGASWIAIAGLIAAAAHMVWQLRMLDRSDPAQCLMLFKSNHHLGAILFAALTIAWLA